MCSSDLFIFIFRVTLPLFLGADASLESRAAITEAGEPLAAASLGMDEHQTLAYWLSPTGSIRFFSQSNWSFVSAATPPSLRKRAPIAVYREPKKDHLIIGTADGRITLTQIKFDVSFTNGARWVRPRVSEEKS